MLRKILYGYPEFWGVVKLFLYRIVFGNNFRYGKKCRLSCKSSIRIRKGTGLLLGKSVHIADGCSIRVAGKGILSIGSNSSLSQFCVIACHNSIKIGENVMIGPNVMIYDHDHDFRSTETMNNGGYIESPVIIEDNVWIGCGTIVLKGVTISSGSVIAAGSIVTRDVSPNHLFYNHIESMAKLIQK